MTPTLLLAVVAISWPGVSTEPTLPPQDSLEYGTVETRQVRVLHPLQDSLLARRVADAVEAMPPLPGLPELEMHDLEIVLAPDEAAFRAASGGQPPHWSAGVAIPSRGRMVLPTWTGAPLLGTDGGGLLRHEWAHLALYRATGGLRAPRWFSEGYAEYAGGWDRTRVWRLRVLLALGRTPPLDSLTLAWPAERAPAESAYLLGASVVEYLVERSGDEGLAVLFRRWREAGSFESAFRQTYGLTTGQFEEDWRAWVEDRYGWLFVLIHSGVAWALLAALLLAVVSMRRRYNREKMARLRARELPEAPAFWKPVPDEGGDPGEESGGTSSGPDPER